MRYQTHYASQKASLFVIVLSMLVILSICTFKVPDSVAAGRSFSAAIRSSIESSYGKLPLSFEVNKGQLDDAVKFLSRGNGYTLFLTSTEAVLSFNRGPLDAVRLKSVGSNPDPKIIGLDELPGKSNYFIGNDPKKWRTSISNYTKVKIEDAYPGIDLVYYGNQRQLEYDWIVAPGADPKTIRFSVESEVAFKIDNQGNLVLDKSGELLLRKPTIYQQRDGARTDIAGNYRLLDKRQIGIQVAKYDATLPLVIDPVLTYSTYLGGITSEVGQTIAVDASGNAYIAGSTKSSDFPTQDPFQADKSVYYDVFVAKLNPSGNTLIYSTYLGGDYYDYGYGIAVDSSGNAYVTGRTESSDFPTQNPFQANRRSFYYDAFVTKLNPSGDALIYSTYFGGDYNDFGYGIAVNSSGNAYVVGRTQSDDFPTQNPFQANRSNGYYEAFVTKFNPSGNALVYSTYLGGTGQDYGHAIAIDSSGNAYVTGRTTSDDFPIASPFQENRSRNGDLFVTKLSPSGNELIYSTYLGGSGDDQAWGIAVDTSGNACVTGEIASTDFPTKNPFQASHRGGGTDAIVAKLSNSGSELIYSTYLGGSGSDYGTGIAVDSSGNAYVTGVAGSTNFPTENPFQEIRDGSAFVAKLNPSGNRLIYSSYLGGTLNDEAWGIALDSSGNAYLTGGTASTDFPTVNPFQASHGGGDEDAFVAKISRSTASFLDLELNAGSAAAVSTPGGDSAIKVGYADATVNSGTAPYAMAVLSYKNEGITLSEAGIPASPPTTSSRIFIDYRNNISALPAYPEAGAVNINTGIAVLNNGSATAHVTYTLRDMHGDTISIGSGTVEAGKYFACFINQLKETNASDFTFPSDFGTTTQFGSLQIASDRPLSVLGLRGTNNQRNDFLMTTTPVADLTKSLSTDPVYFPEFVDGGGYTTALMLLNTTGTTEAGTFRFRDGDGNPVIVNQVGGTADSSFSYSIPPHGAFHFQTDGFPADVKAGWVQLTPNAGTSAPIGSGVFGYNYGNNLLSESGVPSARATTHAHVYVDLSGGHNTGLTIANLVNASTNITLNAYEKDGVTPAGTSSEPISMKANGYAGAFANQFVTGLPDGFMGILDITSDTRFAALTMRSLLNERHDFLMTTFPVADQTRAAPSPIVFPDFVDGGGYTTQFILLSAGDAGGVTLFFYDSNGTPASFIE